MTRKMKLRLPGLFLAVVLFAGFCGCSTKSVLDDFGSAGGAGNVAGTYSGEFTIHQNGVGKEVAGKLEIIKLNDSKVRVKAQLSGHTLNDREVSLIISMENVLSDPLDKQGTLMYSVIGDKKRVNFISKGLTPNYSFEGEKQ